MIEWLYWPSVLVLTYAVGLKLGYAHGFLEGRIAEINNPSVVA